MNGVDFARIIETTLADKGIKKGDFYDATGLSATALYGWKRGAFPQQETVDRVEEYLGISFAKIEDSENREKTEQLESLRDDLRILLRSAKDLPPSSVYALIAQIEKEKEQGGVPD